MHIGFDLDDVLTPLIPNLLTFYNKRCRLSKSIEDIDDWNFFPQEIHEEYRESGGYLRQRLMPGAGRLLEKLRLQDDISIITYRKLKYEYQTRRWLEDNISSLYDDVYLTGGPKLETCQKLGIDLLVDDSKTQVQAVTQEMGIHAVLIRTSMNKEIKESRLIHVAEDIYKAGDLIEKLRPEIER